MKKISKIKGIFLDGDDVMIVTNMDESHSFEVIFRNGHTISFGVPRHTKIITEKKKTLFGVKDVEVEVIDVERIEREAIALRESRDVLINQLVSP
jgi:hypothetical protein